MNIFDKTKIPILSKALDAYALRQRVIASNIANVTTEGYHSQTVTFEDQLAGAMDMALPTNVETEKTDEHHVSIGSEPVTEATPRVVEENAVSSTDPYASGVNDVDVDHEMAELAKNQIKFKFAARMIAETFKGIEKSIRGQA